MVWGIRLGVVGSGSRLQGGLRNSRVSTLSLPSLFRAFVRVHLEETGASRLSVYMRDRPTMRLWCMEAHRKLTLAPKST